MKYGINIAWVGIHAGNGKEFSTWRDNPRRTLFEKVCD